MQGKSKRFYTIMSMIITAALLATAAFTYWFFSQIQTGPGPVEIEVTSNKPSYLQGETVNFTIYVNNPQDWRVEHPWGVDYEIANSSQTIGGVSVSIDFGPQIPTFPSHKRTYYGVWWWDQKMYVNKTAPSVQVDPGFYTLTVSFFNRVDYGVGGNCTFEIRPSS